MNISNKALLFLILFLGLFLFLYICSVIFAFFRYRKIKRCLYKLCDFPLVYSHIKSQQYDPNPKFFKEEHTALLRSAKRIRELVKYPVLSYDDDYETTYKKTKKLLYKVQMLLNDARIDLIDSLNPFYAISYTFHFLIRQQPNADHKNSQRNKVQVWNVSWKLFMGILNFISLLLTIISGIITIIDHFAG